ncbi:MAG: BatD family protein [Flavobacteriaceae bacterium]|nr:BatD family protein [Flavobacteriaceae bacterium]
MKYLSKYILLCFTILSTQVLISQEFKATVSKNVLSVNERLRLTYSINEQGSDGFTPPNFKNFKLVSNLIQSVNFLEINGILSFQQTYSLILQPKSKGLFTIPAATITYKGKTITSNTLKISVQDAVARPKNPNDPLLLARENLFLVAEISNTNPFIGESISIIYKIYFDPRNAILTNEAQVKPPSFSGFWNQNIAIPKLREQSGKYKGRDMTYYIIRKDVLIPQQSGKITLSPMEVNISGVVALNRADLFGQRLRKNVSLTLTAGKQTINVKELPEENKPINFSGAVGHFSFKANSTKNTLKANESAQIKVEVQGDGNLKLFSLPKIEAPNGLEKYEPEHKENITTKINGLTGGVSEIYTVVPQFKGKYKIPALSFSYFNPKEKKYYTLNSTPIIINVPEGKSPQETDNTSMSNVKSNILENDIRFIHTKTKLLKLKNTADFFKSNLFWALLILPLFIIPIGIYLRKKKRERDGDISGNKRRLADRLAKKYLTNAKKELSNKEPFYIALEKALHNYLKAKLQVETSEISKEKINTLLQNKNVKENTITKFLKVLEDCDFARYTPTSNLQMKKEFENAKSIITEIDKQF